MVPNCWRVVERRRVSREASMGRRNRSLRTSCGARMMYDSTIWSACGTQSVAASKIGKSAGRRESNLGDAGAGVCVIIEVQSSKASSKQ